MPRMMLQGQVLRGFQPVVLRDRSDGWFANIDRDETDSRRIVADDTIGELSATSATLYWDKRGRLTARTDSGLAVVVADVLTPAIDETLDRMSDVVELSASYALKKNVTRADRITPIALAFAVENALSVNTRQLIADNGASAVLFALAEYNRTENENGCEPYQNRPAITDREPTAPIEYRPDTTAQPVAERIRFQRGAMLQHRQYNGAEPIRLGASVVTKNVSCNCFRCRKCDTTVKRVNRKRRAVKGV